MTLCPEAEKRAAMDDGEFWEYVLLGPDAKWDHDYDPDDDPNVPRADDPTFTLIPCSVCGATYGACGYDAEGRPMIHATPDEDEA